MNFNFLFITFQNIDGIPDEIKKLYKTVWEISQKTVLKMAADRGAYIDQSQSLNIHIAEPNYGKLTSMHFYAWKLVSFFLYFILLYFLNGTCTPSSYGTGSGHIKFLEYQDKAKVY